MSTAVMSSSLMFDCGDYFKTNGMARSAATTSVTTMTMPTAIGATSKEASQMLGALSAAQNPCLPGNTQSVRRSYSNLVNLIEQHRKLDRSVSEPTSRYKTELCRPFEESGSCKYGDKCQFAHGASELRNLARHPKYKTELCRTFHKIGFCPYGPRCHFVHNFEEARIHNLKVSAAAAAAAAAATGTLGLGPLLQPLSVSAALLEQLSPTTVGLSSSSSSSLSSLPGTNSNNRPSLVRANSLGLTASHSVAAAAAAAAAAAQLSQLHRNTNNAGSDRFNSSSHRYSNANSSNTANCTTSASLPLHRSNSLGLPDQQHGLKPTPLNLSPTFSLGSAADSISPSSSLSQSPTNSMSSFFSDETSTSPLTLSVLSNNNVASATAATTSSNINLPTTAATATVFTNFGQDLGGSLLFGSGSSCSSSGLASPPPQSPSPPLSSRTQSPISPISPNTESRLPIFNKISNNVFDKFDNLKI